jgi:hypothetical protein
MCIFFDVQVGEESQLLLILDGGVGLQGNFDMVANSPYID